MVTNTVRLLVFHDEREIQEWLYHGFVLCKEEQFPSLQNKLLNAKSEAGCVQNKRIHFHDLSSASSGSSKTKTAVEWAVLFVNDLYGDMWFYLFGVNKSNVDYEFFGPSTNGQKRDYRIYNRFFEMGLFSACRYFFDESCERVEILRIFSEKRDLEAGNPFLNYAANRINLRQTNVMVICKQIEQVSSDPARERKYPECVNIINFVDVIMGGFSEVIDYTSTRRGCVEVAKRLFPVCQRLSLNPRNKNSRYYRRYSMSFFPKSRHSKSRLAGYGIKPPEEQFYTQRKLRLYQPKCLPGFETHVS